MDAQSITILVAVAGLFIQAVVAVVVVVAFLWRIPSKDDVKRVEDKADDANTQNQDIQGDIKVLTEKVERIEGYFDTPTLKSR
ncbi:MAG: hypothetical protein OXI77_04775 [Chloroflexota bacterium]|nr:hypothetical protein [Chloroflexota bacterium]MDE2907741.1 hypothetical protein [Chloroflexota bacterium]